jgi:hypothetical protein
MRSKWLFAPSLMVFIGLSAQAQCTPQKAQAKAGHWIRVTDDFAMADHTFPKAQYPALLRRADKVLDLLEQADPSPTGLEARRYRNIRGNSYSANGPVPFGATALYLSYYCVPDTAQFGNTRGTIRPEAETQTWIYVFFNSLGWLEQEPLSGILHTASGASVMVEPHHSSEFQGTTLYQPMVHKPELTEAIIFTPDGRSPYKPLSREGYLLAREKRYDEMIADVEKEVAHQATYRDQGIASLEKRTTWSADRKAAEKQRYVQAYEAAARGLANRRQQLEGEKAKFAAFLDAMPAEESKQQAIVRDVVTMPGERAPMFVAEGQDSKRLATIDRSLFEASGPRDAVRIAVVYWRWKGDDANKKEMIRQFKERFDFKAVREMVGQ